MDTIALFAIGFFGVGGVVAISIVPWICIGTGLKDPDQEYV
jgi:hypothetical protein